MTGAGWLRDGMLSRPPTPEEFAFLTDGL